MGNSLRRAKLGNSLLSDRALILGRRLGNSLLASGAISAAVAVAHRIF